MEPNALKRIFFDEHQHWEKFKTKHGKNIRGIVLNEVEKFRGCGDPKNGFKLLVCEGCHDLRKVPFRCKGRFCTTCSCGETEEWSRMLAEDVFQVNHRHVIFTIDEGLWEIFLRHRYMLKPYMDEAVGILQAYFEKKLKVTPGIIAGLHTFGARMNFNPHVHMLVTMGGMKENGEWVTYDYLPFEMLRKQWQTVVLKLIRRELKEEDKKKVQPLLQKAYAANGDGFYIHGPKQRGKDIQALLGYIGRYIRRPAIAIDRIEAYDGEFVTFRYADKKDGQEKSEKITVVEFISRLIRHIPDEQFKTIRHYGVYARRSKSICKQKVSQWQEEVKKKIVKIKKFLKRRTWSQRIKDQTGKDPMVCTKCECYYEYKGAVCLKEGRLVIKNAVCKTSHQVLERMIKEFHGSEEKQNIEKEEKPPITKPKQAPVEQRNDQLCLFDMSWRGSDPIASGARV